MSLLLAVHAHPDDESLWTGALLATWAREGEVELVTCTRGERGEVIGTELAHLEGDGPALAAHREGELARALEALGVREHTFLDALGGTRLEDSGMAWVADGVAGPAPDVPPTAFVRAGLDDVASWLAAHLARRRPAVVVTYGPDGGYGHPDHVRAHSHTPLRTQLRKMPYTVLQQGKSPGNIRHWQPVRTTYKMASKTHRRSMRGRPRRDGLGRYRRINCHCSSERLLE